MSRQLNPPQPLLPVHRVNEFECGEIQLDEWLKRRAGANQLTGASRTFVVVDQDQSVCGYYAMAAGAVSPSDGNQFGSSQYARSGPGHGAG